MKILIVDTLGLSYDGSTLEKRGLGGSESAVILISKELKNLGFDLTVLCDCNDSEAKPGIYNGVRYIDHSDFKSIINEKYDVAIISRTTAPLFSGHPYAPIMMNAKKRILWLHDTFCEGDDAIEPMLVQGYLDEVFTLSDFHSNYVMNNDHGGRKRMYEVVKHKFWQTRNGAVKWFDEVDLSKKDKNLFVYNASATKGLIPLLKMIWPSVKANIPTAKLVCIGGFYRFREGAEPDEQEKTVRALMESEELKKMDVTFTGVISQKEIAEILSKANFMLYPPEFPETFGISTLESLIYKTPLITSNFGALEETAISQACYKVDYPAVPNPLFPHIDSREQAKKFVETTVRAYHDTYLHQQKQNFCSVVLDICGWDTVALEWKQHFYDLFELNLPVEEYRKVSQIVDKVSRVFGRRTSNSEIRKRYTTYGPERRVFVISPYWNAKDYIRNNILSVASQDYDNYVHLLIDDNSDDGSYDVAFETVGELPEEIQNRFWFERNDENKGAIYNQINAFKRHVNPTDIVMLLDGDDWLTNNNTIFKFYNELYRSGYDFSYGSMWSLADNIPLIAQDYPKSVIEEGSYPNHKFNWGIPYTHLRTFYGHLTNNLDEDKFKDENGEWMKAGADSPLFYELISQSKNPVAVKEVMVKYNDENPLNDYKVRSEEQNRNANMVRYT